MTDINPKCSSCKSYFIPTVKSSGLLYKSCDRCRNGSKCKHNRQKSRCKDCGGIGLCEHGRQKSQCKDCGGIGICEHNRRKSQCKDCGGSEICKHNRQKSTCKDCGGSGICEHNRRKSKCKDCGGSEICEHNRQKYQCKDCGGSKICEHNRRKDRCRECGDVIKKTITRFINGSKNTDKIHNRLDIVNFIDKDFCKLLIEESNSKCCYCCVELDYIHFNNNMITIERIDNTLGHIKSNVKIACFYCNSTHVGNK